MREYYSDQINDNNLLKIICILRLLNIYYCYREKVCSKEIEYNKSRESSNNKNINTNQYTKYVKNDDKQSQKHKSCMISTNPKDSATNKQEVHIYLNTNEQNNYLSSNQKSLKLEIPVIICEKNVSIALGHNIKLKDYILGVKSIKNYVHITDSKVFPLILPDNKIDLSKGKVFIEGVVKSTIEYATADDISNSSLSGYMRHTTSFIPFNCVTLVSYIHPLMLDHNSKEYKTDTINCFLKQAEIFVSNSYSDIKSINNTYGLGKIFKAIHQKLVLRLTICLTQIQDVTITKCNN